MKRDFNPRKAKPLTQDTLFRILDRTQGGDLARQVYKQLTGLNPPSEKKEGEEHERTDQGHEDAQNL